MLMIDPLGLAKEARAIGRAVPVRRPWPRGS